MSTCCDSPSQVLPVLLAISSPLPSHEAWPHRAHFLTSHHSPRPSSRFNWGQCSLGSHATAPGCADWTSLWVSGPRPLPAPSPSLGFFPASLRCGSVSLCQPTPRPFYLTAPHSGCHHALLRFLSQSCVSASDSSTPFTTLPPEGAVWNVTRTTALLAFNLCGCPPPRQQAPCSRLSGAHRLHLPLLPSLPLPHSGPSPHLPNCSSSRESCFTDFFFL